MHAPDRNSFFNLVENQRHLLFQVSTDSSKKNYPQESTRKKIDSYRIVLHFETFTESCTVHVCLYVCMSPQGGAQTAQMATSLWRLLSPANSMYVQDGGKAAASGHDPWWLMDVAALKEDKMHISGVSPCRMGCKREGAKPGPTGRKIGTIKVLKVKVTGNVMEQRAIWPEAARALGETPKPANEKRSDVTRICDGTEGGGEIMEGVGWDGVEVSQG